MRLGNLAHGDLLDSLALYVEFRGAARSRRIRLRTTLRGPEIKVPPFRGGTNSNILLAGRYLSTAASASQVQRITLFLLADGGLRAWFPAHASPREQDGVAEKAYFAGFFTDHVGIHSLGLLRASHAIL
jgi:hypothetical protein